MRSYIKLYNEGGKLYAIPTDKICAIEESDSGAIIYLDNLKKILTKQTVPSIVMDVIKAEAENTYWKAVILNKSENDFMQYSLDEELELEVL